MLAGQLPWPASTTEFTVLDRKRNGQLPPPTEFYPDIPPDVVAYVQAMLVPAPEGRPGSVDELVKQLEGLGSSESEVTDPRVEVVVPPVVVEKTAPPSTSPVAPGPRREFSFARMLHGTVLHVSILIMLTGVDTRQHDEDADV